MHRKEASMHTDFKCLKFEERLLNNALNLIKCDESRSLIDDRENKRYEELCSLNETQDIIQSSLNELRKNATSSEKIKNLDVEYYRQHIQQLFTLISNFKRNLSENFASVKKNQASLEDEVILSTRLCSKFDTASFYKTFYALPEKRTKAIKCASSKNEDIENFQEFLHRNGGHTGGWGDEEHKIFLKYWEKHQNNLKYEHYGQYTVRMQDFIEDIQRIIPDKTAKEISSHAEWLIKYNNLKELQLDAITNWKLMRKADQHHIKILENNAIQTLRKEKQTDLHQNTKERIKEWHRNKDNNERIKNQIDVCRYINNIEIDDVKKVNRKREKEIVAQWIKEQKAEEENLKRESKEQSLRDKKIKSSKALEKIKEFRKRDEFITNMRMTQLKNRNDSKSDYFSKTDVLKRKNDAKYFPRGSYTAFTEQWTRRITKNKNQSFDKALINDVVDNIPKLKVPQWRRGLMLR